LSLHRSIIEERVDSLLGVIAPDTDDCSLRFVHSLITNTSYEDLDSSDIVDGGQDKQLDVITIEEDAEEESARILVFQTKHSPSFSSNSLIKMANGLSWMFERPKSEYESLIHQPLIIKIREIRSIRQRLGPSNISVEVYFVTTGDTTSISDEFKQELNVILKKYNSAFGSLTFSVLGSAELVVRLNEIERAERRVDDVLEIVYDINRASLIEYDTQAIRGVVCSVAGTEIARLVSGDREKSIFDRNLRYFLGGRGGVNSSIFRSSTNPEESTLFWFFNNGITIVCDTFQVNKDPDYPQVILKNAQIVNGCQTSVSLRRAHEQGLLGRDVRVLVKIFQTASRQFFDRIVLTTNYQNSISSRDLKANDPIQIDYQRAFREQFDLLYERKANEFKDLPPDRRGRIISNEKVAQAYLAIVKKRPTRARGNRSRVWSQELYSDLFPTSDINEHVLAYLIYDYCRRRQVYTLKKYSKDDTEYGVLSYGLFHIARVVARLYTRAENWSSIDETRGWIDSIMKDEEILCVYFDKAVVILSGLAKKHGQSLEQIDNAFKASDIETNINRALNPPKTRRQSKVQNSNS
jgi:hypothetical protein